MLRSPMRTQPPPLPGEDDDNSGPSSLPVDSCVVSLTVSDSEDSNNNNSPAASVAVTAAASASSSPSSSYCQRHSPGRAVSCVEARRNKMR